MHLVELRVADAARELLHHDLVRPGIGQLDLLDAQAAGALGDDDDAGWRGHGYLRALSALWMSAWSYSQLKTARAFSRM